MHGQYPCLKVRQTVVSWLSTRMLGACLLLSVLAGCSGGVSRLVEFSSVTPEAHSLTPDTYMLESAQDANLLAQSLRPSEQRVGSWMALKPALERSRKYVAGQDSEQVVLAQGELSITWAEVARTLARLDELLPQLDANPGLLAANFRWIRLTEGAAFSGYYEPVFKASRTQKKGYAYPLYSLPSDLKQLDLGQFKTEALGQHLVYRMERGVPVPYYSRAEIDGSQGKKGVLRGKGLELAWLADPVDAYFLHVQGSGIICFEDGTEESVLYAGVNGKPYLSLGRYMSDMGMIPPDRVSMQSIRAWLDQHPEEREALLQRNERYVFFRKAPVQDAALAPVGSMGAAVTPWVSLAVDRTTFPLGALLAFAVDIPNTALHEGGTETRTVPFRGIGFAQDSGEAIKKNRVDLFCGRGDDAAYIAGHLNGMGQIWLLLAI